MVEKKKCIYSGKYGNQVSISVSGLLNRS